MSYFEINYITIINYFLKAISSKISIAEAATRGVLLKKGVLKNFTTILRKTPVPASLFQ